MKLNKVKRLPLKVGEGLHTHAVESEKEDIVVVDSKNNIRFQLSKTTMLAHEEHDNIPLEKGMYSTGEQNEYDYFTNSVRTVFD